MSETATRAVDAPWVWQGDALRLDESLVPLADDSLAELAVVASALQGQDGPIEDLRPDDFTLSASAAPIAGIRERLYRGCGFAILDRLPVERWDERTSKALAWLLVGLLGPIVMQKRDGTRLYEVRDTGTAMGHGVRRSITNLEQELHTDGGWLPLAPELVCLACMRQAERGGWSRVASLGTAHNRLLAENAVALERLYRPFYWDRQAEHGPEETPCSRHPVFQREGATLIARYYDDYLRNGQRLMAEPLTEADEAALQALRAILEAPENRIAFRLEPGQIAFFHNHRIAHARSAFEDGAPQGGRLLLRLWVRERGGIAFEPAPSA
ncbi:MAG: TauD/TfdA family dioxygenase [Kiloniellales bacterium]|nr:TauD/TfdA family dioxygenase [Kiloniellales bacterium]